MDKWDRCGGPLNAGALKGRPWWGGLDLGSTSDLTSLCLLFHPLQATAHEAGGTSAGSASANPRLEGDLRRFREKDHIRGKATAGFEPANHGFAIRSLGPLGHVAGGRGRRLALGAAAIA